MKWDQTHIHVQSACAGGRNHSRRCHVYLLCRSRAKPSALRRFVHEPTRICGAAFLYDELPSRFCVALYTKPQAFQLTGLEPQSPQLIDSYRASYRRTPYHQDRMRPPQTGPMEYRNPRNRRPCKVISSRRRPQRRCQEGMSKDLGSGIVLANRKEPQAGHGIQQKGLAYTDTS